MIKKYISIAILSVLLIGMAGIVSETRVYYPTKQEKESQKKVPDKVEKYQQALAKGADLVFWYDDASYDAYFTAMAADYYKETEVVVKLEYVDTMDYVGAIYDATMKEGVYPDVYLLSGEELEKAHLYGVAGENINANEFYDSVAQNAITASVCHNKMFGYPLSFNVCLLAYNNEYFEKAPESLQAIIDYSNENEPDEQVQYLLEWDAYDPFFGFLFVSESVVLNDEGVGVLEASYNEAILEKAMEFLEKSLASFSIPLDTVTEESVLADVLNGTTLCAIVDSDSMAELGESTYDIAEFPRLNEELYAKSVALTDMLIVNEYSDKQEDAGAFAKYLTLENYENVWEMSGHYPVQLQSEEDAKAVVAYHAYERAIPAPNSQDAGGFWIEIKNMITEVIKKESQ